MTGIGEAASIIGVIQFGFSLAKTLNEYVGEFQNAAQNITSLANEIETTYRQGEELEQLLQSNKTTRGFSDSARINAESCCLKAVRLGEDLWQLLRKSNVGRPKGRDVQRDDLNLSLFDRAIWLRFKPRIEEAEKKFLLLKLDIAIAIVSYHGQNDAPRDIDTLEHLKLSKKLAVRELRAARKKRRQSNNPDSDNDDDSRHAHFASDQASPPRRQRSRASSRGWSKLPYSAEPYYYDPYDFDDTSVTSSVFDDVEKVVLDKQRLEQSKKQAAEEERAKAEATAVEVFKKHLIEEVRDAQLHAEESRKRLSKIFGLPLNAAQIDEYVGERQAVELDANDVGKVFNQIGKQLRPADSSHNEIETLVQEQGAARPSRLRSFFTGRWRNNRSKNLPSVATTLQTALQPQHLLGGLSFVGLILSRNSDLRSVGRVQVSVSWLAHVIRMQEAEATKNGAEPTQTIKTYGRMSPQDRLEVENQLRTEGLNPDKSILIYARQLDRTESKTRKAIQAASIERELMEFYVQCYLLIYVVPGKSSEDDDSSTTSYGAGSSSSSDSRAPTTESKRKVEEKADPLEEVRERRRSRRSSGRDYYGDYYDGRTRQVYNRGISRDSLGVFDHHDRYYPPPQASGPSGHYRGPPDSNSFNKRSASYEDYFYEPPRPMQPSSHARYGYGVTNFPGYHNPRRNASRDDWDSTTLRHPETDVFFYSDPYSRVPPRGSAPLVNVYHDTIPGPFDERRRRPIPPIPRIPSPHRGSSFDRRVPPRQPSYPPLSKEYEKNSSRRSRESPPRSSDYYGEGRMSSRENSYDDWGYSDRPYVTNDRGGSARRRGSSYDNDRFEEYTTSRREQPDRDRHRSNRSYEVEEVIVDRQPSRHRRKTSRRSSSSRISPIKEDRAGEGDENSEDDGTTDYSISVDGSEDESLKRLKAEAAVLERFGRDSRERRPTASSSFTEAGTEMTESPKSLSNAEEGADDGDEDDGSVQKSLPPSIKSD